MSYIPSECIKYVGSDLGGHSSYNWDCINEYTGNTYSECTLSPYAVYFSSIITSFVGAIFTGVTAGYLPAFMSAWISWFSVLRILGVGLYYVFMALLGRDLDIEPKLPKEAAKSHRFVRPTPEAAPPSFLGWAGWVYSAVYFPVVQFLWLARNFGPYDGAGTAKVVRAIGVGVSALPLTMDTRFRYAEALGEKFGGWAKFVFTWWHALATLALGANQAVLLVLFVLQELDDIPGLQWMIAVYAVFSVIWFLGSLRLLPPMNASMTPGSAGAVVAGLLGGAFAGVFLSFPAFIAMQNASTRGKGIEAYLSCEGASVLDKFLAIFP